MRSLPGIFILELTRRCNHSCLYCYTVWGASELGYPPLQEEMSASDIMQVISKLRDEVPLGSIALSGGEPLLKEGLSDIVDFIRRNEIGVTVITNGSLLTPKTAALLGPDLVYEIPLLSFQREVHDELSGHRGAWDGAVNAIINGRNANCNPVAVFVATKQNWTDLKKTAELAIALGADALMYNRINIGARNMRLIDKLLPTPSMIRTNLDALELLGEDYGLPISVSVVLEPCVIDMSSYKHIKFMPCPRVGENSYFTIDPEGNIRICNHSPYILGNILRDSFRDIYYNHPYLIKFRESLPVECRDCNHPLKDLCYGGCRAASEQCYGTIDIIDPFVTYCMKADKID